MAFPFIPVFASMAAVAFFHRKKRSRSDAIVVIQGASAKSVDLEVGERLSIHFLESPGEDWRMVDAPDGFLMGASKIKWEDAPGERKLKTFNFSTKRAGKTSAEFVKFVEGGNPKGDNCSKIEIFIA